MSPNPSLLKWPLLASLIVTPAYAHHSRAMFDQGTTIEIRGEVVDFKLRSPHSSLIVDGVVYVEGVRRSGEPQRWELESEALAVMRSRGVEADTFEPGDTVALSAHPHRDGEFRFAQLIAVAGVNGEALDLEGSRRASALQEATSQGGLPSEDAVGVQRIAGKWVPQWVGPGDESVLPLNERGLAAWRAYDQKLSPANTCEPMSIPEIFHAPFYLYEIAIDDGQAVLTTEAYQIRRVVPLNGEPAPADPEGLFGTVTGRIEGDALVIESRGYPPSRWGLGAATQLNGGGADVPSSEQKEVVERYSVSEDGRTLLYDYTLIDPVYLREPYSYRIEFLRMPDDTPIYPYECDRESASMFSRDRNDAPLRVGE